MNEIVLKFNSMSDEEKRQNQDLIHQYELLEFKLFSIRDILWFKQGHLKMSLPNELKEKGIKKILTK